MVLFERNRRMVDFMRVLLLEAKITWYTKDMCAKITHIETVAMSLWPHINTHTVRNLQNLHKKTKLYSPPSISQTLPFFSNLEQIFSDTLKLFSLLNPTRNPSLFVILGSKLSSGREKNIERLICGVDYEIVIFDLKVT